MNCRPSAPATVLRRLAAAAAVCLVPACGPDEPPVKPRAPFRAPPPEVRKTERPARENSLWLQAWRDLRERIQPLAEQMLELQKFFSENNLDPLLELDPATLETDRLCSLFHFLERGCFTVEREILVELLERRLARPQAVSSAQDGRRLRLKDHLAAAMQRDEQRLMDIESAIARYQAATGGDIRIPESLTPEELYELRTTVRRMMDETRHKVDQLDARIASLQAQLNPAPDSSVNEQEEPAGADSAQ